MEFKSRTALAQHFKELEKKGYVTSSWLTEPIEKDGKPITRATRIFKINFDSIIPQTTKGKDR